MPFLVELEVREDGSFAPGRQLRASDFDAALGQENNPEWKTVAWDETRDQLVVPRGSIGFRWGETGDEVGKWNLESLDAAGTEIKPLLSLVNHHDSVARVAFPYFGGIEHEHFEHVKGAGVGAADDLLSATAKMMARPRLIRFAPIPPRGRRKSPVSRQSSAPALPVNLPTTLIKPTAVA